MDEEDMIELKKIWHDQKDLKTKKYAKFNESVQNKKIKIHGSGLPKNIKKNLMKVKIGLDLELRETNLDMDINKRGFIIENCPKNSECP